MIFTIVMPIINIVIWQYMAISILIITSHHWCCYIISITLWWTNILPWSITIFNRKIHYFYGHFPLLFVCSPEGRWKIGKMVIYGNIYHPYTPVMLALIYQHHGSYGLVILDTPWSIRPLPTLPAVLPWAAASVALAAAGARTVRTCLAT